MAYGLNAYSCHPLSTFFTMVFYMLIIRLISWCMCVVYKVASFYVCRYLEHIIWNSFELTRINIYGVTLTSPLSKFCKDSPYHIMWNCQLSISFGDKMLTNYIEPFGVVYVERAYSVGRCNECVKKWTIKHLFQKKQVHQLFRYFYSIAACKCSCR